MSAHRHLPRLWDTGCKAEAWTSPPGPGLCIPANVRRHTRKMLMLVRSAECFANGARVSSAADMLLVTVFQHSALLSSSWVLPEQASGISR